VDSLCDCVCHSGLFAGENCSGKLKYTLNASSEILPHFGGIHYQ